MNELLLDLGFIFCFDKITEFGIITVVLILCLSLGVRHIYTGTEGLCMHSGV